MNFPNPFKKKDDSGYELDNYSIPSISDASSQVPDIPKNSELPPLPSSESEETPSLPSSIPSEPSFDSENDLTPQVNSFDPSLQSNKLSLSQQSSLDVDTNSIHNEVSRVKIDSMEAKISLIEAKMTNIDHKLELITEMLKCEVSEETKRKLRIDSVKEKLL